MSYLIAFRYRVSFCWNPWFGLSQLQLYDRLLAHVSQFGWLQPSVSFIRIRLEIEPFFVHIGFILNTLAEYSVGFFGPSLLDHWSLFDITKLNATNDRSKGWMDCMDMVSCIYTRAKAWRLRRASDLTMRWRVLISSRLV